jgi:hypothetical protein
MSQPLSNEEKRANCIAFRLKREEKERLEFLSNPSKFLIKSLNDKLSDFIDAFKEIKQEIRKANFKDENDVDNIMDEINHLSFPYFSDEIEHLT